MKTGLDEKDARVLQFHKLDGMGPEVDVILYNRMTQRRNAQLTMENTAGGLVAMKEELALCQRHMTTAVSSSVNAKE